MPLITPDYSEAQSSQPIPSGTYSARIKDCQEKVGKSSGNPYLNWKLEIFDSEKYNNRIVFLMTMLSGAGAGKLRDLYEAATGLESDGKPFDTDQLLGKEVKVTLVEARDEHGNVKSFPDVKSVAHNHPF